MKNKYLALIKIMIILSPVPFGCVGRVFHPLFYFLLLIISWIGLQNRVSYKNSKPDLFKPQIAFGKEIRFIFFLLAGFILFQIVPLPVFFTKLISPVSAGTASSFGNSNPGFSPVSLVPYETLMFLFRFFTISIFFLVSLRIDLNKNDIISLARVIIFAATFQSLFGLIKLFLKSKKFFIFFLDVNNDPTTGFLTGTFGNPNHLAFFLEMTIPILTALIFYEIGFFKSNKGIRSKLINAFNQDKKVVVDVVLLVLISISLILTGSRSGIVTLLLSIFIFSLLSFYLKRSKAIRKRLKYILIAIALVSVFFGIKNTTNKFMKMSFSESGRFLRWPNTVNQFSDFPVFGSGFGTYRYSFFLYDTDPSGEWSTHAHNEYLEVLAEGGITGGILLFLLNGLVIFSIAKMWRARRHPGIRILGIGILSSLFAVTFHSFFDFALRIPANMLVYILLLISGLKLVTHRRDFSNSGLILKNSGSLQQKREIGK